MVRHCYFPAFKIQKNTKIKNKLAMAHLMNNAPLLFSRLHNSKKFEKIKKISNGASVNSAPLLFSRLHNSKK
jgi:hypothetical protein